MRAPATITAMAATICVLAGSHVISGCNLISGSTDYEVRDDDIDSTNTAGGSTQAGGLGGAGGAGGAGGTTSTGGTGGIAGVGGGGGCMDHWNCPTAQICLNGGCSVAWSRQYRFTVVGADIPAINPNNNGDWDVGGGAPDAYVEAYDGPTLLGTTMVEDDTLLPTWNTSYDIVLNEAGGDIKFDMYDEDLTIDDFIIDAVRSHEQWLEVLRTPALDGTLVTNSGGILFTVTIAPL